MLLCKYGPTEVNECTGTQDVQKEGAEENTREYEQEVTGELRELIGKEHRNYWLFRNTIRDIEIRTRRVKNESRMGGMR
jgi:hypothetical protein